MRAIQVAIKLVTLLTISAAWPGAARCDLPEPRPSATWLATTGLRGPRPARDAGTGLDLRRLYRRGAMPVVFIHGLWDSPRSWAPMIEALEADPALRDRYQFWTFGYETGDPILYSACRLRWALDRARAALGPDGADPAFDRMVLVGHSMGGLVAKLMVEDSGPRLWGLVSGRPFEELRGAPGDRELFRQALFFRARSEVRRVIFIATPHCGSRVDGGCLGRLGARLAAVEPPLRAAYARLEAENGPTFFRDQLQRGLPTSVDDLAWGSPLLATLSGLPLAPGVTAHSIIADTRTPPRPGGDGLVPYESAHLDGVASEALVSSGHRCQGHPAVIREVRRILIEHAATPTLNVTAATGVPWSLAPVGPFRLPVAGFFNKDKPMTAPEEIRSRVKKVIVQALGADEEDVTPSATLIGDLGAESIDFLDVVFRLEREFGIEVPRGELFVETAFRQDLEIVRDGRLTPEGLAALTSEMPYINVNALARGRRLDSSADLFTVDLLVKYITWKLAKQQAPGHVTREAVTMCPQPIRA